MTYFEIMQKAGKQIHPKIYYYDNDSNKIEFEYDDIIKIKPFFNAGITGTVMKGLFVTLKSELPNKPIYFSNTAKYSTSNATKIYGPYYLKEKPSYNADNKSYEHKLYDGFLSTMVDYVPINIEYPCTLLDFFKQLVLECGFTTNITSLPNGSRIMKSDIYENINFTYRDVFDDIGGATGSLFKVKDGVIQKCDFGTNKITINDDILKNKNISLGEHFGPINSIILSRSGESDKIYKRDENLTSWNEFEISDNQLMNNNDRSDYLDELYNALYGIEYDIFDLELVGYGGFEPLEKIEITTGNNIYNSYVFNNEMEFTQGFTETIYTDMPEENNSDYKSMDTTDKRLEQAYILVDKQKKLIEAYINRITDMLDCIKNVKITGDNLFLEKTPTSHGAINKLSITGFTLQTLYPNMAYASDYTYPNVLNFYTLIFSNEEVTYSEKLPTASEELENKIYNVGGITGKYYRCVSSEWIEATDFEYQEVYINSPIPLQGTDELLIEDNNVTVIQRVASNGVKLKEAIKHNLGPYTIPTFETNTYVTFKYFKNLTFDCKYLIKNDMTSIFTTQVETIAEMQLLANQIALRVTQAEMKAAISLEVDKINLEVAKKVNSDEIIASINLSPEKIKILANKLEISANDVLEILSNNEINLTSKNISITADNFSVDKDGNMTCNDATMNNGSFSGNVYLNDGGLVIGGTGILSTMIINGTLNGPQFLLSGDFCPLGDEWDGSNLYTKEHISFSFYIPDNFTVTSAYIYLQHEPCETSHYDSNINIVNTTGYCRNLALYKGTLSSYSKKHISETVTGYIGNASASYSQITNAWQSSGTLFNGSNSITSDVSINLKSSDLIKSGLNHFAIMSTNGTVSDSNGTLPDTYYEKRGAILATMYIQGYLKN